MISIRQIQPRKLYPEKLTWPLEKIQAGLNVMASVSAAAGLQARQQQDLTNGECQREEAAQDMCVWLAAQNHLCHKGKSETHQMKCLYTEHAACTVGPTAVTSSAKKYRSCIIWLYINEYSEKCPFILTKTFECTHIHTHKHTHSYICIYMHLFLMKFALCPLIACNAKIIKHPLGIYQL